VEWRHGGGGRHDADERDGVVDEEPVNRGGRADHGIH
jgi:hypothetical protein